MNKNKREILKIIIQFKLPKENSTYKKTKI